MCTGERKKGGGFRRWQGYNTVVMEKSKASELTSFFKYIPTELLSAVRKVSAAAFVATTLHTVLCQSFHGVPMPHSFTPLSVSLNKVIFVPYFSIGFFHKSVSAIPADLHFDLFPHSSPLNPIIFHVYRPKVPVSA